MISVRELAKTGNGKMLLLLWALTAIVLVAMPVLGSVHDEVAGNLAFGFLLGSALLNLSIIVAYKVGSESIQLAKAGWIGFGVVILGFALYRFDGQPNSDIAVFLGWAMLVHAFPVGLIVSLLFAGISYFLYNSFSVDVKVGYFYLLVVWLVFFAAGYLQWFKLLPSLIARFRRK